MPGQRKEGKKLVRAYLTPEEIDVIKKIAAIRKVTVSDLIKEIVYDWNRKKTE
jgi:predicted DNA-binding ribbon-helix-helix protein